MIQIAVLNLKRRHDRRAQFEQINQHADLEFVWVEAIDGQQLNFDQLLQQNLISRRATHFSQGHLGCSLSHRFMWERCIQMNKPLIICEDDAILRQDFASTITKLLSQLPSNWEILLLGYNFDSIIDTEIVPGVDLRGSFTSNKITGYDHQTFVHTTRIPTILPLNNAFGLCIYAISPQGATTLIQRCFPLPSLAVGVPALNRILYPAESIDAVMNAHYRQLQAFCAIPPIAISPNQDSDTR